MIYFDVYRHIQILQYADGAIIDIVCSVLKCLVILNCMYSAAL